MKYTHIVFDIDGTLIDTESAVLCSLKDVVSEILKIDIATDELRFALGIPSDDALRKLGIDDLAYGNLLWQKFFFQYSDNVKVFNDIHEVLDKLTRQSCVLGILTSRTKAEYRNDFVPFGLADYFNFIVCADDTVHHKPHSEPMAKFLELSNADARKVLYIGDTVYDLECAQGVNVDFALALWGCKNPEGINANYLLSNPCDIESFV